MNYEERVSLRQRRTNLSVYMPLTLIDVLDRYADSINQHPSTVVTQALREFFQRKNDEAKAGKA